MNTQPNEEGTGGSFVTELGKLFGGTDQNVVRLPLRRKSRKATRKPRRTPPAPASVTVGAQGDI